MFSRGKRIVSTCVEFWAGSHVGRPQLPVPLPAPRCPPCPSPRLFCGVGSWSRKLFVHRMPRKHNAPTRLITLTLLLPLGRAHKRDISTSSLAVTSCEVSRHGVHFECVGSEGFSVETLLMQAVSPPGPSLVCSWFWFFQLISEHGFITTARRDSSLVVWESCDWSLTVLVVSSFWFKLIIDDCKTVKSCSGTP